MSYKGIRGGLAVPDWAVFPIVGERRPTARLVSGLTRDTRRSPLPANLTLAVRFLCDAVEATLTAEENLAASDGG